MSCRRARIGASDPGSNVCSITGTTLTCFAESVPDGVFEVLEIDGTISRDRTAERWNNEGDGRLRWRAGARIGHGHLRASGGHRVRGRRAIGDDGSKPDRMRGRRWGGGGDEGELPDTATGTSPPIAAFAVAAAFLVAASVLLLRTRRRT